jgi:hypothetical protein
MRLTIFYRTRVATGLVSTVRGGCFSWGDPPFFAPSHRLLLLMAHLLIPLGTGTSFLVLLAVAITNKAIQKEKGGGGGGGVRKGGDKGGGVE